MKNTSKTIVFFGTEDFSLVSLRALIDAGYHIGLVVTKPDARRGRGKSLLQPPVKQLANTHGIPVQQPNKLRDVIPAIRELNNPIGILVSFGKIVPTDIIKLFHPGIINVHPSLLPKYRGPSPIESAILNGDNETGVTIMQLSPEMDAGPLFSQVSHPLNGSETRPELYQTLAEVGARELLRVIPAISEGSLVPTPQDNRNASYCSLLSKSDSLVNPTLHTAIAIERRVRAFLGFPRTRLNFHGQEVIVTAARIAKNTTPYTISCKGGTLLEIIEVISPHSGRIMDVQSYLNGLHKKR